MRIVKTRDVKTPTRELGSAGIDFYIPNDWTKPLGYLLSPGGTVKIPSGIHVKIPKNHVLVLMNRSSVADKGLQVGACVIDENYQGEIHIHLTNVGNKLFYFENGAKVVQGLVLPINEMPINEVNNLDELYEGETQRGSNGFGSTGNE